MQFNFRIDPKNKTVEQDEQSIQNTQPNQNDIANQIETSKTEIENKVSDEDVQKYVAENRKKMLSNSMQKTVLNQLARTQPTSTNAQPIPMQNVESRKGW